MWDPDNPREVKNGAPKGSGALWNDNPDNPGKWPLVKADNPIGQWNTFTIKMVGSRVWISLNGKPTVEGQVLDNYFDRKASRSSRAARSSCRRTARRSASATSSCARFPPPRPRPRWPR